MKVIEYSIYDMLCFWKFNQMKGNSRLMGRRWHVNNSVYETSKIITMSYFMSKAVKC